MNNYELSLDALDLTPYRREWCCVCGKPKTDGHHVIYRSQGGKKRHVISLCWNCHRLVHVGRLHFKADGGSLWVLDSCKSISIDTALKSRLVVPKGSGPIGMWRDLSRRAGYFETECDK